MSLLTRFTKTYLTHLSYFYRNLGYRLIILVVVGILVGLMDALGLAMFLPLLELSTNPGGIANSEGLGNLAFLLDGMTQMGLELTLTTVLLVMLFFFLAKGIAQWLESYLTEAYLQYFVRKIRIEAIDSLSVYRFEAFSNADAGVIQNSMSGEVERVVQAFRQYSVLLQQLMMLATYTILAFMTNPQFAVLVLMGGALVHFIFQVIYKKTKQLSGEVVLSYQGFQGLLIQQVAFFKYLKATGYLRIYADNLKVRVNEIAHILIKMGALRSILAGVREPLMIGVVVLIILFQVNVMGGTLSTIMLSILFFYRGLQAVMGLQGSYNNFLANSGSLASTRAFIEELQLEKEQDGTRTFEGFREAIQLVDLHFAYQPEMPILRDINLTLHRYETLALIGSSGAGKTTLMNVLSGLLTPTRGQMLIDGTDSRDFRMTTFQQRIGYITQDPVIFDDTIYNNVTFWADRTAESLYRFEEALRKASILEFVDGLPDRYETRLGNNGIHLSGGQKQRIAIARELYKEVDFLFLDEATSALDSGTEQAIHLNLDQLRGQLTIVIIAHRLSTIKNADRLVVMSRGGIEDLGSYETLLRQSESFREMIALQEI